MKVGRKIAGASGIGPAVGISEQNLNGHSSNLLRVLHFFILEQESYCRIHSLLIYMEGKQRDHLQLEIE